MTSCGRMNFILIRGRRKWMARIVEKGFGVVVEAGVGEVGLAICLIPAIVFGSLKASC